MSPRTGRPKSTNPKNAALKLRLRQDTLEKLQACATELNTRRTAVVEKGIDLVAAELKKK